MLFVISWSVSLRLRSRLYSSKMQKKIRVVKKYYKRRTNEESLIRKQSHACLQICSKPPFGKSGQELESGREKGDERGETKKNNHELMRRVKNHEPSIKITLFYNVLSIPSSHLIPNNPFFFQPNFMRTNRPNVAWKSKKKTPIPANHITHTDTETQCTHPFSTT